MVEADAEDACELVMPSTGAWDYPLTRKEKMQRLLQLFEREVQEREHELAAVRQENVMDQPVRGAAAMGAQKTRDLEEVEATVALGVRGGFRALGRVDGRASQPEVVAQQAAKVVGSPSAASVRCVVTLALVVGLALGGALAATVMHFVTLSPCAIDVVPVHMESIMFALGTTIVAEDVEYKVCAGVFDFAVVVAKDLPQADQFCRAVTGGLEAAVLSERTALLDVIDDLPEAASVQRDAPLEALADDRDEMAPAKEKSSLALPEKASEDEVLFEETPDDLEDSIVPEYSASDVWAFAMGAGFFQFISRSAW